MQLEGRHRPRIRSSTAVETVRSRSLISMKVTVLEDIPRTVAGSVDEHTSFEEIRASIVKALRLEDPTNWIMAVSPQDSETRFGAFTPTGGDEVYLIRRRAVRGEAFVLQ